MAYSREVLTMLLPDGGWACTGETWEGVQFFDAKPITKKQWQDGFAKYDAWKAEQDQAIQNERQAILDRLGLTADELKTILG
jgi:hypothetical protein